VVTTGLGASSVDLQLRMWCAASDYWPLKFEMTRKAKEALDEAGIEIPFPQRVVHLQKSD
jgi:small conductance mechanosensitive channel